MIRLTRNQVREIDRLSIEQYRIPGVVLMENAARGATEVAWDMLGGKAAEVLILCGGGNNGGDGLAMARHLHNRGAKVKIRLTTEPSKYRGDAKINWDIVTAMGLDVAALETVELAKAKPELVVDSIFGTGLEQEPRQPFGEIVQAVAKMGRPVLAVDLPSGMDCDTGKALGACIWADRTVTFVAEKVGFGETSALEFLGTVTVVDIGCPVELVVNVLKV